MKVLTQILILYCSFISLSYGQFQDFFEDGDLATNPTWLGDLDHFKINEQQELQLNRSESGSSFIHTAYNLPQDCTWKMDFKINTAPSKSNNIVVYFMIDQPDLSKASGYFFKVGENGSDDALHLYRLDQGTEVLLASCTMGALAQSPAQLSLRIDRIENIWTIYTDYSKMGAPVEELMFMDETYDQMSQAYFALQVNYTSSKGKQYFFDNISAQAYVPDTTGPKLLSHELISPQYLILHFDEAIQTSSLGDLKLDFEPVFNSSVEANLLSSSSSSVALQFEKVPQSGVKYTMQCAGLQDEKGNLMTPTKVSFEVSEEASPGDLVINEILFDPQTGSQDYIELMNVSQKLLNLKSLTIRNVYKEGNEVTLEDAILLPKDGIIAFSKDTNAVKEVYKPLQNARFYEHKIPSLNKDKGNVTLHNSKSELIDSFSYQEDYHLQFLDNTKGVSLERIFPNSASTPENFVSGVELTNYGTPGYKNANLRKAKNLSEAYLQIENPVFSPNEDGQDDQLIIRLKYPESGYLSSIRIFDTNGQQVQTLCINRLSGTEDLLRWDGIMTDGGRAPIGHYFIVLEAFNLAGESILQKKHIKLLDFF